MMITKRTKTNAPNQIFLFWNNDCVCLFSFTIPCLFVAIDTVKYEVTAIQNHVWSAMRTQPPHITLECISHDYWSHRNYMSLAEVLLFARAKNALSIIWTASKHAYGWCVANNLSRRAIVHVSCAMVTHHFNSSMLAYNGSVHSHSLLSLLSFLQFLWFSSTSDPWNEHPMNSYALLEKYPHKKRVRRLGIFLICVQ